MYEKIESEYNYWLAARRADSKKTEFMKQLASSIGTTLSNLYEIIKDGLITVLDYELNERIEFNANTAWNKRTKKSVESNSSKRESSKEFIKLVIKEFRSKYNINSIDEIILWDKKLTKNKATRFKNVLAEYANLIEDSNKAYIKKHITPILKKVVEQEWVEHE